nr:RNA-directed DNA polymerase, eukaryota [Tanacetum cinerariifolium]
MHDKGIILYSSIKRKVKDGSTTRFWRDAWIGDNPLERQFPRLFCLEADRDCLVRDKWQNVWVWCWTRNINGGVIGSQLDSLISMIVDVQLIECQYVWQWSLIGSNIFTVKDTQIYIDFISFPEIPIETKRKSFEVPSLFCLMCNISPETSSHLFWSCPLATSIWRSVFKWTDLPLPDSNNQNDAFNWLDHVRLNSASKSHDAEEV